MSREATGHDRGGLFGFADILQSAYHNRYLIWQLTKREIVGRYRGSMLGLAWSLLHPIIMLGAYTFVFAVVFRARWGMGPAESTGDFAIVLFAGLIIHGVFAECINRAPLLVVQNVNYVKKVVFPLDILPLVSAGSAVFHSAISLAVLLVAQIIMGHGLPWTVLLFPLLVAPLLIATIGISWILTSLGVYARDITQLTGVFTTVLLFLSPVFYPISALPLAVQPWLMLNPLTFFLEAGRGLLIFGQLPNLFVWLAYAFGSLLVAAFGYWWFQRARRGFADVL